MSEEFPGWEADKLGGLTLTVTIAGEEIRLATVTYDAKTGLFETFIGLVLAENQLGRTDASRERAVAKAEEFPAVKLSRLL